jgi:hypothetical protein
MSRHEARDAGVASRVACRSTLQVIDRVLLRRNPMRASLMVRAPSSAGFVRACRQR